MTASGALYPQKSTIVRARNAGALIALRTAFGVLERVAPAVGARWAEQLWCTPPRPRTRRDNRPGPGERFTVMFDGRPIAVETWGSGPNVYLMHGWGGWRGQLGGFVTPLVEAGYRVVAFDALSHGDSGAGSMGARRSTLLEFADALGAVVTVVGPAHAVVAHSAGCVATALAVSQWLTAERLVFVAPMSDPAPYLDQFAQALGLGERIRGGFLRRLEQRVGMPMRAFHIPGMADPESGRPAPPPTLVIHDRRDKETWYADGVAIAASWPGAELMTTDGLGHRRILRDPDVITAVVRFITASPVTMTRSA